MPDIVTVAGMVEPLRSYNYQVTILSAPTGLAGLVGIEFRAKTVRLPAQSFDTIEIPYRWFRWFVQGREAGDKTIEITWWEGEDLGIYSELWSWREIVGDWLSGVQGRKQDISGDLQVSLLDGSEAVMGNVIVRNAFLTDLGTIDLSYDNNNVVEVTATFKYDWLERA